MIINIRGTSGTGKSTLAKAVMALYKYHIRAMREGRKKPILTWCTNDVAQPGGLVVPGHYDTPCGGCDTINKVDDIFDIVRRADDEGRDVLFEGLLMSGEVRRTSELVTEEGRNLLVLAMDVPLEECLRSINERRAARGVTEPVNPKATVAKYRGTQNAMRRLAEAGVATEWVTRDTALDRVRRELGV